METERLRGLNLAARNGVDARAHDFYCVGTQVDGHRQNRRLYFVDMNTEAGQAEEHEEQLHDERRIADQFHIARHDPARPFWSGHRDARARDADHGAEQGRDRRESQCDGNTAREHPRIEAEAAEIERIGHGVALIVSQTPYRKIRDRPATACAAISAKSRSWCRPCGPWLWFRRLSVSDAARSCSN